MESKATSLKFSMRFTKGGRTSDSYRPDERNADAEARICLECPLPDCKKNVCKRYNEAKLKLKGGK